jgi:hypothetical protein
MDANRATWLPVPPPAHKPTPIGPHVDFVADSRLADFAFVGADLVYRPGGCFGGANVSGPLFQESFRFFMRQENSNRKIVALMKN